MIVDTKWEKTLFKLDSQGDKGESSRGEGRDERKGQRRQ